MPYIFYPFLKSEDTWHGVWVEKRIPASRGFLKDSTEMTSRKRVPPGQSKNGFEVKT